MTTSCWPVEPMKPTRPLPSGDHVAPFHRAMRFAPTPPADEKLPAATMSPFGMRANADTGPLQPTPRGDHAVPFQRAM